MALLVLVVLTVIVAEVASLFQQDSKIVLNLKDYNQAYYLAVSGINKAIYILLTDETQDIDSLGDKWACPINEVVGKGSYDVQIIDEQRKLNINDINSYILTELLKQCKIDKPEETANKILDYRDIDEFSQYGVTEKDAKNLLFDSIGELKMVIQEKDFFKLKDYLSAVGQINLNMADIDTISTLLYEKGLFYKNECEEIAKQIISLRKKDNLSIPFTCQDINEKLTKIIGKERYELIKDCLSTQMSINVNTASKEVLSAFFLGVLGADTGYLGGKIVKERIGKPFKTVADIYQRVTELSLIDERYTEAYIPVKECLGVQSRYFTIISIGRVKDSPIRREIISVVERYSDEKHKWHVRILSWLDS